MKYSLLIVLILLISSKGYAQQQMTNEGNLTIAADAQIAFYGDVVNNGTLIDSGQAVTMAGDVAQKIGGDATITFNNLTLNNTSNTGITLAQDMHTQGTLTFTDGILNTNSSHKLVMDDGATVSGAGNSSFVAGPMRKTGQQSFTFPVGKDSSYAPVTIGAPDLATDQYELEYFHIDPDSLYDRSQNDSVITSVSACEYWQLNRTNGSSDVTVNLSWDKRSCDVSEISEQRVVRWNGSKWKNEGNGSTTGDSTSGTVTSSSAITGFSPFTNGQSDGDLLPVELLYLKAGCKNGDHIIKWGTAVEINNERFTVEVSQDALEWRTIGDVQGGGNTTITQNYAVTNPNPADGILYYRLKQTDANGNTEYVGGNKAVDCGSSAPSHSLTHYPNPTEGQVRLSFESQDTKISSIEVLDAMGRVVYFKEGHRTSIDISGQAEGTYFLTVHLDDRTIRKKVMIQR